MGIKGLNIRLEYDFNLESFTCEYNFPVKIMYIIPVHVVSHQAKPEYIIHPVCT